MLKHRQQRGRVGVSSAVQLVVVPRWRLFRTPPEKEQPPPAFNPGSVPHGFTPCR